MSGPLALVSDGGYQAGNAFAAGVQVVASNAAGQVRGFGIQSSQVPRWLLAANSDSESGSNAGSTLQLTAYSDAGSAIDNPITVVRASGGTITLGGSSTRTVAMTGPATVGGSVTATGALISNITGGTKATITANAVTAGTQCGLTFQDGGTAKWAIYKETTNTLVVYDVANTVSQVVVTAGSGTNGTVTLAGSLTVSGGQATIGSTSTVNLYLTPTGSTGYLIQATASGLVLNDRTNTWSPIQYTAGLIGAGTILFPGTLTSTSSSTGAVVCSGGVGIAGATYLGSTLNVAGTLTAAVGVVVTASGILVHAGGLNVQSGSVTTASPVTVTNTTASTSTSTGALIVSGGAGFAGAIYAGGNVVAANFGVGGVSSTGNITINAAATSNRLIAFQASAVDQAYIGLGSDNNLYIESLVTTTNINLFANSSTALSINGSTGAVSVTGVLKTGGAATLGGASAPSAGAFAGNVIWGRTDGGSQTAGAIGESNVSEVGSGSLSSGSPANLTSITLSAGTWRIVGGTAGAQATGTTISFLLVISASSGSTTPIDNYESTATGSITQSASSTMVFPLRVSALVKISSSTTYYLNISGSFSSSGTSGNSFLRYTRIA